MQKNKNIIPVLWTSLGISLVGLLIAKGVFGEMLWLTIALAVITLGIIGALLHFNRQALKTRQTAFGVNSAVTAILVICIVGVVNFIASRYPQKLDLTKNKVHTLSDQTNKLVKGLTKPVHAVVFAPVLAAGATKSIMDHMKGLNPQFEVEYVDPSKEPTRVKQVGIKKVGTLMLSAAGPDGKNKEERIEDPTEEKITNALIKVLKDRNSVLCTISGHGERSFTSQEAEGYEMARRALANQNYELKELILSQETKIDPGKCDAITIIGPTKAFFEKEVAMIDEYLASGGRAIVSFDVDLKGSENAVELQKIVAKWGVKAENALTLDPIARLQGSDVAVPVTRNHSRENSVTKDLQIDTYHPLSRPLTISKDIPSGLTVTSVVKMNPTAWGETDFGSLRAGGVNNDKSKDIQGPITTVVAVDGKLKDSKATKNTRIVVFGSSNVATNLYQRFGGNLDLFANAISWVLEDENLISIRAKEDGPGKVELTPRQSNFIALLTVILIPLAIAIAGIVIWVRRKKL